MTDLVVCAILLPLIAAAFLIVALAVKLDDGGPVLFRQIRIGRGTKPFEMLKFRTMRVDPERASGAASVASDLVAERAKFQTAQRDDPRITKVGRILRATHLDELPQILNVMKGDMSLVGVRPDVPVQQVDYTSEEWDERHLLRPGITGLAQIDHGANSIPGVRTQKDLEWVRTRTFDVYLKVLLGTVRKVVNRSGV
ncbi:sugar transferase (plasmid) [Roseobacter sp. A03A-229]